MNVKRFLNMTLMAALACGLSLFATSCHDDNNGGLTEEEQAQQALEQQERDNTAFAVLDYLADVSNAPADFLSGTYEPTIGRADDSDANIRIVKTNDMETAAQRFADLAEVDVDEDTPSYTWSDERLGTLTYTKSTDGKSWATVDVSIKQIPHLQKIIYRSPEQADNNGGFEGTAYYRFGDIVSKKNADGVEEYWICVRPAFGPEGKDKSHWVTICPLSSANVWTYTGSNDIKYALPTMLGDNHEHSQNFAELLFAICFPEEWENNIINNPYKSVFNKGVPMFHDFDKANVRYHRKYFWERVKKAWTDNKATANNQSIMSALFGLNIEEFQSMLKSEDGLNLLTNGYSWNTTFSNSPTLYRYRFVNGEGKQSNMHQEPKKGGLITKYHSVSAEVIKSKIKLNVNDDYSYKNPGWSISEFFGTENKHYIIRHATGAQLSSIRSEDPKQRITGVSDVYVYNQRYNIIDLDEAPETFNENGEPSGEVGTVQYENRGFYTVGDVLEEENGVRWFCVQESNFGSPYDSDDSNYAYFVSFNSKAIGKQEPYNVPNENLAAQMLFNMQIMFTNAKMSYNIPAHPLQMRIKNIKEHAEVDLYELIAQRDTLFKTSNYGEKHIHNEYGSVVYRNADDDYCALRLVADYTVEQASDGGRDLAYRFQDTYSVAPEHTMYLHDLIEGDSIRKYADDQWIYLPWYDIVKDKLIPSSGKLKPSEALWACNPLSFIYTLGSSVMYKASEGNMNMYREPLFVFAVKRVKDKGRRSNSFEDGTIYKHVSLMSDVHSDFREDVATRTHFTYYAMFPKGQITLNGEPFPFLLNNKP